jgi:pyrroline-5-carboxylate reductase
MGLTVNSTFTTTGFVQYQYGFVGESPMKKTKVSIIGAGQMGTQIGKVASEQHEVIFFDKDSSRSREAAKRFHAKYENNLPDVLNSPIIILAVAGDVVIDLIQKYHARSPRETLWVNISTFVTLKDIRDITGDVDNVLSCKIIGHFEMMSPENKCVFVIHNEYPKNELTTTLEDIFREVGIVIYDDEEKYLKVNYMAAEEAMKSVINLARKLQNMNMKSHVVNAAIKQVFLGTAQQFPYLEPDYFHELVYQKIPELKGLNEEILKLFSGEEGSSE